LTDRAAVLARNSKAARERERQLASDIEALETQRAAIRQDSKSRSGSFGFFGEGLTPDAKAQNDALAARIDAIRAKTYRFDGHIFNSIQDLRTYIAGAQGSVETALSRVASDINRARAQEAEREKARESENEKLLRRRRREEEKKRREQAKAEKLARQAALAQAHLDKIREAAEAIRRQLPRTHPCPYCLGGLGLDPHADHIHPVSRGGLSTIRNMVYVCRSCNQKKRDMTLNQFIRDSRLDRTQVFGMLQNLGKDY
jgi:5-methylcytosine-specific restriction endonuclease McrA